MITLQNHRVIGNSSADLAMAGLQWMCSVGGCLQYLTATLTIEKNDKAMT